MRTLARLAGLIVQEGRRCLQSGADKDRVVLLKERIQIAIGADGDASLPRESVLTDLPENSVDLIYHHLLHSLSSGMTAAAVPPTDFELSYMVTECPSSSNLTAQAMPAGPAPIMPTL